MSSINQPSVRSLENKTVVFVACGSDLNKITLYRDFAFLQGLHILLLESEDNILATRMHQDGLVHHIAADMTPRTKMVQDMIHLINVAMKERGKCLQDVDGVVTFWDDAVALTARIATYLNLPSSPVEAIDISHDKFATRVALAQKGLPYPKHTLIFEGDDVSKIVARDQMCFPLVLKPVQGATSIGVYICHDMENLKSSVAEGIRVLKNTYESNELMGLVFDDAPVACTKQTDKLLSFVLEDYIDGPEVDVDMIVSDGKVVYAKVSDDWEPEEPWRTETGVNYPSRLPVDMQDRLSSCATDVVKAFGITHGVLHVEMKYSSKYGPMLIELNPRMGGGPCHFFHKELYNVDLAIEHVMIATGQNSRPTIRTPDNWGVGLLLYAMTSGTVSQDVGTTEEYRRVHTSEHVVKLSMPSMKGDRLCGWHSPDFPSHAGLLMCSIPRAKMDIEEACSYADSLRSLALSAIKYQ